MAFRSSATSSTSSGANLTASPAGAASGDVLLAFMAINNNGSTATPPTGWSSLTSVSVGGGGAQTLLSWYKVATGSDSFTFTSITGSSYAVLTVSAYTGRENTTPFAVTPVTTAVATSNATPYTATLTGLTANAGDDVICAITIDGLSADRWSCSAFSNNYGTATEREDTAPVNFVQLAVDEWANQSGASGSCTSTITRDSGTGTSSYCGIVCTIAAASGSGSSGTIAVTLANITPALSGTTTVVGTAAPSLANATADFAGTTTVIGTIGATLDAITAALSGTITIVGTIAVTLADMTCYIYQAVTGVTSGWLLSVRRRRRL